MAQKVDEFVAPKPVRRDPGDGSGSSEGGLPGESDQIDGSSDQEKKGRAKSPFLSGAMANPEPIPTSDDLLFDVLDAASPPPPDPVLDPTAVDPKIPSRPARDGKVVPYMCWASEGLARGTRPFSEDFPKLKGMGFRAVVFLGDSPKNDEALSKKAGLFYLHLPLRDQQSLASDQLQTLLNYVIAPQRRPVLICCADGREVTGLAIACYRLAIEGQTIGHAAQEAQSFGLSAPVHLAALKELSQQLASGKIPGFPLKR